MKIISRLWQSVVVLALFAPVVLAGHGYGGGGGGGKVAFLLLTLAVGYWVLTIAYKQKKPLNIIGKVIGGLILAISLTGLICVATFGYCKYKNCKKSGCGLSGGSKPECHYKLPK